MGMQNSDKAAWGMATGREAQGGPLAGASGWEVRTLALPRASFSAPSPTPPLRPPRSRGRPGLSGGGLAPLTAAPSADPQHVRGVHGAPGHLAAGQQRQGHARLAVRLQPPAGRDHTVRPPRGSPRPPAPTGGQWEVASVSGPPGSGWASLAPGGRRFKGGCGGGGAAPTESQGQESEGTSPGRLGRQGRACDAPHASLRAPMGP